MHRIAPFATASLFVASIVVGAASLPRPAQAQAYEVLHAFEQAFHRECLQLGDSVLIEGYFGRFWNGNDWASRSSLLSLDNKENLIVEFRSIRLDFLNG